MEAPMSENDADKKKKTPPPPPHEGDDILIEFVDHDEDALGQDVRSDASPGGGSGLKDDREMEVVLLDEEGSEGPFGEQEEREEEAKADALAQLEERHLRLRAEFENYRRRVDRDREEMHRQAVARAVSELLPALDNLNLAVKSLEGEVSPDHWKGILLVLQQLKEALARLGVEEIESVGKRFDPAVHEAVNSVVREDVPPMTVTAVYASGYLLGGKVIKPARVEVSRAPDGGPAGRDDA
jgi:molecular chaperone GrpE